MTLLIFYIFFFNFVSVFAAEIRALPKVSYLSQLMSRKFPEASEIPPRNDAAAGHAEAILASAQGRSSWS